MKILLLEEEGKEPQASVSIEKTQKPSRKITIKKTRKPSNEIILSNEPDILFIPSLSEKEAHSVKKALDHPIVAQTSSGENKCYEYDSPP